MIDNLGGTALAFSSNKKDSDFTCTSLTLGEGLVFK